MVASWHVGAGCLCRLGCGQLTSLTRCPGVLEIAQVHSFLLGYLSGQLGLVMVPLVDVTLWSQPAVGGELGGGSHQEPQCFNAPRKQGSHSLLPACLLSLASPIKTDCTSMACFHWAHAPGNQAAKFQVQPHWQHPRHHPHRRPEQTLDL